MGDPSSYWAPCASLQVLKARARILQCIRAFFCGRDYLEVETPLSSAAAATDIHLDSFQLDLNQGRRYLNTSPEFHMKRLLAAGYGNIFQLCRVFREGESGTWHNPEFTLLEWYRLNCSADQMMDEIADLLQHILPPAQLAMQAERHSYQAVFQDFLQLDPLQDTTRTLYAKVQEVVDGKVMGLDPEDRDAILDLLFATAIQNRLSRDRIIFIHDYPASQAALASLHPHDARVAQRFEVFINGIELGNGYVELTDVVEQRRRFEADLKRRSQLHKPAVPVDEYLLAAMTAGLPACAGMAIGVDRLCALATGQDNLQKSISFPWDRA